MRPSRGRWSSAVAASSRARTSSADRPWVGRDDVLVGSGHPGDATQAVPSSAGARTRRIAIATARRFKSGAGRPMALGDGCQVRAMSGAVATCPLCGDDFVDDLSYSHHLRDIHDLVDEDGTETKRATAPGAVTLHADTLAAAAAALARATPDEPEAMPVPEPDERALRRPCPVRHRDAPRPRRRRSSAVAPGPPANVSVGIKCCRPGRSRDDGAATSERTGRTAASTWSGERRCTRYHDRSPTTAPPTTAPPTTAAAPPRTTAPPAPPPPPPPTTTPRPIVRAAQARVVSCTQGRRHTHPGLQLRAVRLGR